MTTHGKLQSTKIRNSNVEVVRLIAMVMIVLNHAPWNALHYVDVDAGYVQRLGPTLLVSFLSNWGRRRRLPVFRDQRLVPMR